MKSMKVVVFILGVFGVFLIFLSGSSIIGILNSPKILLSPWEEPLKVVDCNTSQIISLWNSVFLPGVQWVDGDGDILSEGPQKDRPCMEYVAYRINGNNIYYMSNEFTGGDVKVLYRPSSPLVPVVLANSSAWRAYYIKGGGDFVAKISDFKNHREFINFFSSWDGSEADDRAGVFLLKDAEKEFGKFFSRGLFGFGSFFELGDYFGYMKTRNEKLSDVSELEFTHKKKEFVGVGLTSVNFKEAKKLNQTKNIPNKTFEEDSGWNVGFDLKDYFEGMEDSQFAVTHVDGGKGLLKNVSVKVEGSVISFKPNSSYLGVNWFQVIGARGGGPVELVKSNIFEINIAKRANSPPIFNKSFSKIYIGQNEVKKINLSDHFYDKENDKLNYSFEIAGNLSLFISGEVLSVKFRGEVGGYEKFKINASDGKSSTESNWAYVFLDIPKPSTTTNGTSNNFRGFENTNLGTGVREDQKEEAGLLKIWIWVLVAGIIVLIIAIVAWYMLRRAKRDDIAFNPRKNSGSFSGGVSPPGGGFGSGGIKGVGQRESNPPQGNREFGRGVGVGVPAPPGRPLPLKR